MRSATPAPGGSSFTEDLWVNTNGYIVQWRRDWSTTVNGQSLAGSVVSNLSGFGETNVLPTPPPTATPTPTGGVAIKETTGDHATVSWRGHRPLRRYIETRVVYRLPGGRDWTHGSYVYTPSWSSPRPYATVTGLTCGAQYEFQVEMQTPSTWVTWGR